MRSIRKSGITALTVASATLAAAVLAGGASSATEGDSPPDPPQPQVLALRTGDIDHVAFYQESTQQPGAQVLSESTGCLLSSSTPTLITFKGTVGTSTTNRASFRENSIGVNEKKGGTGTSCYQVGSATSEALTLDFGTLSVTSAYLDVELKQGARILATAFDGTNPVGYFELQSGSSIGLGAISVPPTVPAGGPYATFTCKNLSDSGPDAGIGDNCRWPISKPSFGTGPWFGDDDVAFTSLRLEARAGSFSLEGGADGSVPDAPEAGTVFGPAGASVFEFGLDCDQSTFTLPAELNQPEVTVRRLTNADGSDCTPVPYTLTHDDQSATFLKPSIENTAQFVLDMVWTQSGDAPGVTNQTSISFSPDGVDQPWALPWCPDPQFDAAGNFTGVKDPLGLDGFPKVPDVYNNPTQGGTNQDGTNQPDETLEYACVVSQAAAVDRTPDLSIVNGVRATDDVLVQEKIYVIGDLRVYRA